MGDHHRRCSRARERSQQLPIARKPWFSVQKRCARALRGDFRAPRIDRVYASVLSPSTSRDQPSWACSVRRRRVRATRSAGWEASVYSRAVARLECAVCVDPPVHLAKKLQARTRGLLTGAGYGVDRKPRGLSTLLSFILPHIFRMSGTKRIVRLLNCPG